MFIWLQELWTRWAQIYRAHRSATPSVIAKNATELAKLAHLAECSTLPFHDVAPLQNLQKEMTQLAEMASLPAFASLPLERRRLLARNIERSRHVLIATMQKGLSASERIQ